MQYEKKGTTGILRLCQTVVCRSIQHSFCLQHCTRFEFRLLLKLFVAYRNITMSYSRIFLLYGTVEMFSQFGECIFANELEVGVRLPINADAALRLIQSLIKSVRLAWNVYWLRRPHYEADHSPPCIVERGM